MADVINLRRARKNKARATKATHAATNRAKFGRTKAEKEREELQSLLDNERLEGHRIPDRDPLPGDNQ